MGQTRGEKESSQGGSAEGSVHGRGTHRLISLVTIDLDLGAILAEMPVDIGTISVVVKLFVARSASMRRREVSSICGEEASLRKPLDTFSNWCMCPSCALLVIGVHQVGRIARRLARG